MKSTTPGIEIAMESWGSANEGGAEFLKMGHEVIRIPSQCVKPFVRTNKNDAHDARAICGAVRRPTPPSVPVTTEAAQDRQSHPRSRSV